MLSPSAARSWSQTLRAGSPWRSWFSVALVDVVWCADQMEAAEVFWRLLLLLFTCMLLVGLGGCVHVLKLESCVHALKCFLCDCVTLLGFKVETPPRMRREVLTEHINNKYSWVSAASPPGPTVRPPGPHVPLALALADSLLLCVLHETLPHPSLLHIHTLLSRLKSVSHTLGRAEMVSEVDQDGDSTLTDTVKLISSYLQRRMGSLCGLVGVQGELEAGVRDMLEGLDGLWARLEELHTSVTFSKEGGPGHRDLDTAKKEAETLFAVLGRYRSKLQVCQARLRDSTQLLQELTWSHTHISHSVSSGGESVWAELLLQSNIEQFDKVQESFLSLEQQTSTFQAHLEGLGGGTQAGHVGPLSFPSGAPGSRSASLQVADSLCAAHPDDGSRSASSQASPSLCAAHPADASPHAPDMSPGSRSASLQAAHSLCAAPQTPGMSPGSRSASLKTDSPLTLRERGVAILHRFWMPSSIRKQEVNFEVDFRRLPAVSRGVRNRLI